MDKDKPTGLVPQKGGGAIKQGIKGEINNPFGRAGKNGTGGKYNIDTRIRQALSATRKHIDLDGKEAELSILFGQVFFIYFSFVCCACHNPQTYHN